MAMKGNIPNGPGAIPKKEDWSTLPSSQWTERAHVAVLRGDPKSDYDTNVKPTMTNLSSYTAKKTRR
jgi:hypothetical protein